jgi:hypothetical protein
MGHVDKTVKDVSYERYDWGLTAKSNRKIIDHIQSIDLSADADKMV